jgi:CheY-like chemotaxis protein/two-component sensor histidine kinase
MNAIIGMTKIAENINDITKLRYCLATINASSTHLLGLINDILDMSKIEAGKFELDSAPFNIETMLIKICNIINDKTEQKKQKLHIDLDTNMHMYYIGDELRLSQVITNLLSNAVKFTPEDGRIVVTAHEVRRQGKFSVVRFSISDTGIGMTTEQMGRLFSAFSQADANITQRFGGTGLGLAISKSIVEKMNGKIWVESEPGRGSSFIIEARLLRNVQQRVKRSFSGLNPGDIRLLLVEADKEVQRYFKDITGKFGMPLDVAADIPGAVDLADRAYKGGTPYHVVFLSVEPGSKCLELINAFGGRVNPDTVVIITSFLEWSGIEEAVRAAGVTRFIAKPVFSSGILDAINQVIGGDPAGPEVLPSAAGKGTDFSGVSLLLAEDIEINREIFIALLAETRVAVDVAENGLIAVEKFRDNPDKYDAIIMDVQMPEMNGYEATRTIRSLELERAGTIPIIAMTANAFKEDIDKCLQSGMNDHLTKPIDEKALIEKIAFYSNKG